MQLLLFSDLLVDAYNAQLTQEENDAVWHEVRAAFLRICDLARELQVDAVCCAGNLYDRATCTEETGQFLRAGFEGLGGLPVFIAPGSTDWWEPTGFYGRPHYWSENVHIFTEPVLSPWILGPVTLWGAAHVKPQHDNGFVETFRVTEPGVHIALFHGCELSVADLPHTAPFTAGQIQRSGLTHALVGHVPVAQAALEYTYAGRPAPRREADRNGGGAVVINVDDYNIDRQVLRTRYTVAGPVPASPDVEAHLGQARTDVSVFDKPRPYAEPALPDVEALPRWLDDLLDAAGVGDYDLDTIAAERTVRGEFVERVRLVGLPEDEHLVLRAGLLAVDGKLDAGGR